MLKWMAVIGMIGLATGAHAADAGWGVQFSYDAFLDKTLPMGMMAEVTDGVAFDAANITLACKDGGIAVIFQPTRMIFGNQGVVGRFRGADGIVEFNFNAVDLPVFGKQRAIVGDDAAKLLGIFGAATAPVPYQSDDKSGNFPVVGFSQVEAIMKSSCEAT